MKVTAHVSKRFHELDDQMNGLPISRSARGGYVSYETVAWQQWATSTMGLIRSIFGENSPHNKNFEIAYKKCVGYSDEIDVLKGIFRADRKSVV